MLLSSTLSTSVSSQLAYYHVLLYYVVGVWLSSMNATWFLVWQFFWLHLRLMYPRISQRGYIKPKKKKKILLALLVALFCTPFSKLWYGAPPVIAIVSLVHLPVTWPPKNLAAPNRRRRATYIRVPAVTVCFLVCDAIHCVSKTSTFYFVNNSVKNCPIFTIFGTRSTGAHVSGIQSSLQKLV